MQLKRIILFLVLLLLLAACGQNATPEAESLKPQFLSLHLVVNSVSDFPDANPGDGICASFIGSCTLRAAIEEANEFSNKDKITVPAGLYNVTGKLEITDDVVIMGSQNGASIVDGQNEDTVFYVNNGTRYNRVRVELHRLVIRNGYGNLNGGGILNWGGKLLVNRTLITENNAFTSGGGIRNSNGGILELKYSTVSHNGDMWQDEPSRGGGIVNDETGHMLIFKSTISHNQGNRWGGIANFGTINLVNSTVSHNLSRIDTGGFINVGRATLSNVTLAFNEGTVDYDDTGHESAGGLQNTGSLQLKNTIISNNINHFSFTQDCLGSLTSRGYNLIQDPTDCTLGGDLTGNLSHVDPLLQPLSLNGSVTETHALAANSPARNAGNPAVPNGVGFACEATDQRNKARGFGPAGRCDIGAFEFQAGPGGFTPR